MLHRIASLPDLEVPSIRNAHLFFRLKNQTQHFHHFIHDSGECGSNCPNIGVLIALKTHESTSTGPGVMIVLISAFNSEYTILTTPLISYFIKYFIQKIRFLFHIHRNTRKFLRRMADSPLLGTNSRQVGQYEPKHLSIMPAPLTPYLGKVYFYLQLSFGQGDSFSIHHLRLKRIPSIAKPQLHFSFLCQRSKVEKDFIQNLSEPLLVMPDIETELHFCNDIRNIRFNIHSANRHS